MLKPGTVVLVKERVSYFVGERESLPSGRGGVLELNEKTVFQG
jgi:hypothetical protein